MSQVMTFYRFAHLGGPALAPSAGEALEALRASLEEAARQRDLKGTILLAAEGINGTLSGALQNLESFADRLRAVEGLADMPFKFSAANPDNPVFYRLKVRIKPEIVALGHPEVDPAEVTGTHVDARTWNRLLDDPELMVIDTRNDYEISIGTFPGAVDPGTRSFKQFPDYVAGLDPARHPRVAMFCTGGVRCEKASTYMLARGFKEVFQLDGGILRYLETIPPEENRWRGECFVFDQRVSVDAALKEGSYEQCYACRRALTRADLSSPAYEQGVSCPYCIEEQDAGRRRGLLERQRQVELAADRGERHVGQTMPARQRESSGSR